MIKKPVRNSRNVPLSLSLSLINQSTFQGKEIAAPKSELLISLNEIKNGRRK